MTVKPTIPITDKRFKYTSAANTSLERTFARVRRQQREAAKAAESAAAIAEAEHRAADAEHHAHKQRVDDNFHKRRPAGAVVNLRK